MVLGEEEKKKVVEEVKPETKVVDLLAPTLVDNIPAADEPVSAMMIVEDEELEEQENESYTLQPTEETKNVVWDIHVTEKLPSETTNRMTGDTTGDKMILTEKSEVLFSDTNPVKSTNNKEEEVSTKDNASPASAASGGYLARPSNIYAESKAEVSTSMLSAEEPVFRKTIQSRSTRNLLAICNWSCGMTFQRRIGRWPIILSNL